MPVGLFFEINKLNNFCSICLYKIFTRKKLSIGQKFDSPGEPWDPWAYLFRTTRPFKFDKIDNISRPEVTSSKQKNCHQVFIILHQSWKFHANQSSSFWKIACTKSIRKRASPFFLISKERPFDSLHFLFKMFW